MKPFIYNAQTIEKDVYGVRRRAIYTCKDAFYFITIRERRYPTTDERVGCLHNRSKQQQQQQ